MYIDSDTHYWHLRFLDKVTRPGKGYIFPTLKFAFFEGGIG